MVIKICKDYEGMSRVAANVVAAQIIGNPGSVLGLATGSTPEGTYRELVGMHQEGMLCFDGVATFNLDEYVGIARENEQSYYRFMHQHLFDHVDIQESNVNVPDTQANLEQECRGYEQRICQAGGIDLQIVGVGNNGHIGFNEPADSFAEHTNVVQLQQETILANARFFDRVEQVPTQAITMGIGTIMRARRVLLLANGTGKADIIYKIVHGPITPNVPASILRLHPECTVLLDAQAGSLL